MLNTMIVATVTPFSGTTTPDKNGNPPIMLQCIAGTMPNRNVLAGTVAQRAGFEVGNTYLVNVRETGYDDIFGPDFTFIKVMQMDSGLDIVRAAKELGDARIMYVQRPEGFEQHYQRVGNAIESNRTRRMKEGLYHPTTQTTITSHQTAREIRAGSSVGSGGTLINEEEMLYDEQGEPVFPEPEEDLNQEGEELDEDQNQDQSNPANPIRDAAKEERRPPKNQNTGNRGGNRGNRGNR
jgi:hypothetical protein